MGETASKSYDLTRVHEANLSILKEIDRICKKYKIKYMMDSGTLLGAVRHKGFVPWDDDADVVFTRSNYEMFLKVARRELPSGMTLVEPDEYRGGKAFFDFTPRIIYEKSQNHADSAMMKFYDGKLNHLWVDIFILDKLPENKIAAELTRFLHKTIYGMAMGHRYQLDFSKYGMLHRIFVRCLSLAGRLFTMKFLFRMQKAAATKDYKGKSHKRFYSNYQPDYLYVTLEDSWCEETVNLDFCDTKLMAPKGWDQVLTQVYGDYRKLPPKEKQVPAHSSMEIKIFD